MTVLWVLDLEGYDTRGGNASVFSSVEAAKAAANSKHEWRLSYGYNRVEWTEQCGMSDAWVIYPVLLDSHGDPKLEGWTGELGDLTRKMHAEWKREKDEREARWQAEHPLVPTANGLRRQP